MSSGRVEASGGTGGFAGEKSAIFFLLIEKVYERSSPNNTKGDLSSMV